MFQHMASSCVGETEPWTELASYSYGGDSLIYKIFGYLVLDEDTGRKKQLHE